MSRYGQLKLSLLETISYNYLKDLIKSNLLVSFEFEAQHNDVGLVLAMSVLIVDPSESVQCWLVQNAFPSLQIFLEHLYVHLSKHSSFKVL